MALEKVELIIGQEYSVELYPKDDIVKAKYVGEDKLEGFGDQHLFVSEGENKSYVAMSNHWLRKKDDGTLTYISVSSASTSRITKEGLRKLLDSKNKHDRNLGSRISKFLEIFGKFVSCSELTVLERYLS